MINGERKTLHKLSIQYFNINYLSSYWIEDNDFIEIRLTIYKKGKSFPNKFIRKSIVKRFIPSLPGVSWVMHAQGVASKESEGVNERERERERVLQNTNGFRLWWARDGSRANTCYRSHGFSQRIVSILSWRVRERLMCSSQR